MLQQKKLVTKQQVGYQQSKGQKSSQMKCQFINTLRKNIINLKSLINLGTESVKT